MKLFYSILLIFSLGISFVQAQDIDPEFLKAGRMNVYYLMVSGDKAINVNVLGEVGSPGMYIISTNWKLDALIAAAGGPSSREIRVQDKRTIRVRITRESNGGRVVIYDEDFEDMLIASQEFPTMEDGDIVVIDSVLEEGFSRRDIFPVVSAVGTIVSIIVTLLK